MITLALLNLIGCSEKELPSTVTPEPAPVTEKLSDEMQVMQAFRAQVDATVNTPCNPNIWVDHHVLNPDVYAFTDLRECGHRGSDDRALLSGKDLLFGVDNSYSVTFKGNDSIHLSNELRCKSNNLWEDGSTGGGIYARAKPRIIVEATFTPESYSALKAQIEQAHALNDRWGPCKDVPLHNPAVESGLPLYIPSKD